MPLAAMVDDLEDKRPTETMDVPPSHVADGGTDDRGALAAGAEVGGYVIEHELGRGGMGTVYAATHPVIGKRAAIKVLKPSLSKNPATVERFLQEARAVNRIGHPNIVDIFAFDSLPDGRRYLVMDLLDGESLRARVRRGPLHVREAANVIDEIASALIAAHDKGFIHRDLKPDNVFLVAVPGRTDVKLLDFGLAKLLPGAGAKAYRTATGAMLGTPDYMSPEQLRGGDSVDPRTDIYSLGVMAFELLTGRKPKRFTDGTFDTDDPLGAQLAAVSFLPAELSQLIEAMTAMAADDRPSLAAVRAVIKRTRPSLPSMSVAGLEVDMPPVDPLAGLTASQVGATPVVATPAAGSPVVAQPEQQVPSAQPPPRAWSQQPSTPALRTSALHPVTTVGVPPPPLPPPTARNVKAQRPRENTTWLVIGAVLMVAAGVALALVLAT